MINDFLEAVTSGAATPSTWPLSRILALNGDEYCQALDAKHELLAANIGETYIYGAGQNGQRLVALLKRRGLNPIGFIDDTLQLQGSLVAGIPVFDQQRLTFATERTLVVVSMFSPSHSFLHTKKRLASFEARVVSLHTALLMCGGGALPFNFLDIPKHFFVAHTAISALSEKLVDDSAFDRLWRFVVFSITFDENYFPIPHTDRFCHPATSPQTIFVDGGAYDGDTIKAFLANGGGRFKKIHAFEPDRSTFRRLSDYVSRLPGQVGSKIHLHNKGLWQSSGELGYESSGTPASHLSEAAVGTIPVCALDDICRDPGAYMIKLDVEGAEEQAILGMTRLVREQSPYIEVAIYHKPTDLYRLPQLILNLNDRYRFDIRAYGYDGADTMLSAVAT